MTRATEYAARLDNLAAAIVEMEREAKGFKGQRGGLLRQKVVGMVTAYGIMAGLEDYPDALAEAREVGQVVVGGRE